MMKLPISTIILFCLTVVHCQPTAVETYQSQQVAASLARKVVSDAGSKKEVYIEYSVVGKHVDLYYFFRFAGRGTILTLMDESVSSEFNGYPFGIMEYYSDKCSDDGNLLLFMSDLQVCM